jgi:glycine cleavage system transcriptional repressor
LQTKHLADVIIQGESTPGLIDQITDFFKQRNISVSAFRLKFLDKNENKNASDKYMKCKMVISIPHELEVKKIEHDIQELLQPLNIQGSIKQNH